MMTLFSIKHFWLNYNRLRIGIPFFVIISGECAPLEPGPRVYLLQREPILAGPTFLTV